MEDYDGKLGIYSQNNILTEKLKQKFEDKYLNVNIFENLEKTNFSRFNYLIINLLDDQKNISQIKNIISNLECKIIVLFPLYVKPSEKYITEKYLTDMIDLNPNLGIILVPELLGTDVSFIRNNVSHDLIMQTISSERIKIKNESFLINSISVGKLVEVIVKEIFSFGISGHKLALIGPRKNQKVFAMKYLGIDSNNLIIKSEKFDFVAIDSDITIQVDFSLRLAIKRTRDSFLNKTNPPKGEVKVNKNKIFLKILIIFVLLLSTPIILILISILLFYVSYKFMFVRPDLAKSLIMKTSQISSLAKSISFGNNQIYDTSNIIYELSELIKEGYNLTTPENFNNLFDFTDALSAGLDKIHTGVGFLESDISELDGIIGVNLKKYLQKNRININIYKNKIYAFKKISSRLTDFFGSEKPKKYLVLFQNNMEIRPTGGFIGSFAIITLDKGKLTEIVVNDIYSADGQLKGHVDPPEPIRKYLGEGGWFMRDANWDPDFPSSALKIEWFLDKEVGNRVDGVIAIDLNFVQRLLKITGPVNLTDFGKTIDSDNLYQITQSEVENEFFPGSIKKKSFLTSLSKNLISSLQNLDKEKNIILVKEVYESLERNHVQLYLHDVNFQEAIDDLGYSGRLDLNTDCGLRCFSDSYSLVDANLGVNKANQFIKRSQELNLSISKESISHELLVTYQNLSSSMVGALGIYKDYARVIMPMNLNVTGVRAYNLDGSFEDLSYDVVEISGRREIGFYFELLPSSSKRIQIVWSINSNSLDQGGEYNLKIVKQAGTDEDDLKVILKNSDLFLTGKAQSVYNTNLAYDFDLKLYYKP